MKITRFEDLRVWQLAHRLSLDIADLVRTFPKDEKYDLSNQMRRSARSIPADISEGFGRFHFNDKLTFYGRCGASLDELKNHFHEAFGNKYIEEVCYKRFLNKINESQRSIPALPRRANFQLEAKFQSYRLASIHEVNKYLSR